MGNYEKTNLGMEAETDNETIMNNQELRKTIQEKYGAAISNAVIELYERS